MLPTILNIMEQNPPELSGNGSPSIQFEDRRGHWFGRRATLVRPPFGEILELRSGDMAAEFGDPMGSNAERDSTGGQADHVAASGGVDTIRSGDLGGLGQPIAPVRSGNADIPSPIAWVQSDRSIGNLSNLGHLDQRDRSEEIDI